MLSGASSGAVCLAVLYPLDFARTRVGTDIRSPGNRQFRGSIDCLRKAYSTVVSRVRGCVREGRTGGEASMRVPQQVVAILRNLAGLVAWLRLGPSAKMGFGCDTKLLSKLSELCQVQPGDCGKRQQTR